MMGKRNPMDLRKEDPKDPDDRARGHRPSASLQILWTSDTPAGRGRRVQLI